MKQAFVGKTFSADTMALIQHINMVLAEYAKLGYDLSLRQLYYQLVSQNIVPNTEQSYKRIGSIVNDARLAGLIDWDMIVDRGRSTEIRSKWDSPADIVAACANQFHVDYWEGQDNHVEVMVEKQALEGVLLPVCEELDVPFTANKGYSSASAMYEAGKRMYAKAIKEAKDIHIIYLGDHDPSGIDMTRDVEERLKMFSLLDSLTVHRVALNMDQIEQYQPPENPAKLTDSRATSYIRRYGYSSWELDALPPDVLAAIVQQKVISLRDTEAFRRCVEKEQRGRDVLASVARELRESA